ncbi:MAG: regulatory iron-sulfur-containing complex subunit RicT [Bacteroidales bacterium]|jgi:cell fate regulator YaaT (PSP1 superfamily)|nr:regulatory iron-sulfur-containing complex subunit RicT [Bacteroidales bacterium]
MTKSRELERGCRVCEIDESTSEFNIPQGCFKLDVYDWLKDIPQPPRTFHIVEVRFKNTRKGFYENINGLPLRVGDIVAVESSPGHDIGIVSLTGELVKNQLSKNGESLEGEFKKVYRKAKQSDIQKWKAAVELELSTMLRTREMIRNLSLNMKLGDVEFQGDKTKAIFYYIADERVDFRELIKIMAEEFRIRVEMKQIGARQEAGRLGGIGPCGRELCCTTWLANFRSTTTHAARAQELSPNPQKLAGQCGKLKCCINYELPTYVHERKKFPAQNADLETKQGKARHVKNDILKHIMYYELRGEHTSIMTAVPIERVKEIMSLNKKGDIPDKLLRDEDIAVIDKKDDYASDLNEDSLNRFEGQNKKKRKSRNKKRKNRNPKHQGKQNNEQKNENNNKK